MGRPFQTPFTKPRGEGLSSSTVNLVWGFFNLVFAYLLISRAGAFNLRATGDAVALGLGMFLEARRYGRFNGGDFGKRSRDAGMSNPPHQIALKDPFDYTGS